MALLWWVAACTTPPLVVPDEDPTAGGMSPTLGDPLTQVGAECTAGSLYPVGWRALPTPEAVDVPEDTWVVFPTHGLVAELTLSAEGVDVPVAAWTWPSDEGPIEVLVPEVPLAPDTEYALVAIAGDVDHQSVYAPFWTTAGLAAAPGLVEVTSIQAGAWTAGWRRLTVELAVVVAESAVVRLHPGACGDPADGVVAVVPVVPDDESVTVVAIDLEAEGADADCVCAVVMSAAGVDGTPSETLCL